MIILYYIEVKFMVNNSEETIIDTDYKDTSNSREINGKPILYTTSQVANMLDITDSALRFYCKKFKDFIQPEMSGSHRRFTDHNIEQLKHVIKLKEEGLTIGQIQEYGSLKDKGKLEKQIVNHEPVAMKVIATEVAYEIAFQLEDFKEQLKQEMLNGMMMAKNELEIAITSAVDSKLDEKFNKNAEQFKSYIDQKEIEAKQRDHEMMDFLKNSLEQRQQQFLQQQEEKTKKSFLSKIFNSKSNNK
jgi:DNA-binding transcriptional MerR regulator